VAVVLDAFVVRTVIAPAMIALIGERFWWLPRWLEWLPRIGVEGPAPEKGAAGDGARASDAGTGDAGTGGTGTGGSGPGGRLAAGATPGLAE
jgi:hypothetical protein